MFLKLNGKGVIKRSFLWFIAFFLIFYALAHTFFVMLSKNQEKIDIRQTTIIQENVKDRFALFLKLPHNIAILGADYFASGDLLTKEYGPFAKELLNINKEILGLSVLDHTGRIVRVYPPATNQHTQGKISQNFEYFRNSYQNHEKYWLSPPFKLFQGCDGFALYVPVIDNKVLKGWFTPLICSQVFLERFRNTEFFKSYELIIKDEETGLPYFSTAMVPDEGTKIHESHETFFGRRMIFQSWRKDKGSIYEFPRYWNFFAALILASLFTLLQKFYFQRKKARTQLAEISVLLKFTSKEALANLIDMQSELTNVRSKENITWLMNLIEQIDLLQTMAQHREGLQDSNNEFLPLLQEQLDLFSDLVQKKELKIVLRRSDFSHIKVAMNGWLIQNSVLSSVLSHSIIYAEPGSVLEITQSLSDGKLLVTFHTHKNHSGSVNARLTWDRRMEVAKKVLQVHGGDLFIQNDLAEGMIIRIMLPQ